MADKLVKVGDLTVGEQVVTALSGRRAVVLDNPSMLLQEGVDVRWEDGKRLIKTLHEEVRVRVVTH